MMPRTKAIQLVNTFGKELAIKCVWETINFVTPARLNEHTIFVAHSEPSDNYLNTCRFDAFVGSEWTFLNFLLDTIKEIEKLCDEEEQSDTLFFIVKHSKKFSDIATQNIELLLGKNHRVFAIIADKPNVFKIKCVSRDKFHEYLNK